MQISESFIDCKLGATKMQGQFCCQLEDDFKYDTNLEHGPLILIFHIVGVFMENGIRSVMLSLSIFYPI